MYSFGAGYKGVEGDRLQDAIPRVGVAASQCIGHEMVFLVQQERQSVQSPTDLFSRVVVRTCVFSDHQAGSGTRVRATRFRTEAACSCARSCGWYISAPRTCSNPTVARVCVHNLSASTPFAQH